MDDESAASTDLTVLKLLSDARRQDDALVKANAKAVPQPVVSGRQLTSDTKSNETSTEYENEVDVDLMEIVAARAGQRHNNVSDEKVQLMAGNEDNAANRDELLLEKVSVVAGGNNNGPAVSQVNGNPAESDGGTNNDASTNQRPTNVERVPAAPGAYRLEPGQAVEQVGPASRTSFQVGSSRLLQAPPPEQYVDTDTANSGNNNSNQYSGLVEADEVPEDEDLENAMPVDHEEVQRNADKMVARKQYKAHFIGGVVWLLMAAALVIGLVVGIKDSPTVTVSSRPSTAPSSPPTDPPTPAPTGILDDFVEGLPDYTQESLKSGDTPQRLALDWLEKHPNVTNLPDWRKTQMFALVTFFYAFEGPNWKWLIRERWLDYELHECLWFSSGFGYFDVYTEEFIEERPSRYEDSCDKETLQVFQTLSLSKLELAGLSPSIPPEIVLLTNLSKVELYLNDINTTFSSVWPSLPVQMTSLTSLRLWGNDLSGVLPAYLGQELPKLQELSLWDNILTGKIPVELGLLTDMSDLGIQASRLTGAIPTELGVLTKLTDLLLFGNQLTGSLPSELAQLSVISYMSFNLNQLTGSLPTHLGLMTTLTSLILGDNQLSGPLPSEVGLMTSLEQFQLQNNILSGTIPSQLNGSIPGLNLGGNQFTGIVPLHLCPALKCDCQENASHVDTCLYLDREPEWPGRFPSLDDADVDSAPIMINIKTDLWPEETEWIWQRRNETGMWEIVEQSDGALQSAEFLHSYPVVVIPNSTYKLSVMDAYFDGLYDPGYVTLTDNNGTTLFSLQGRVSFDEGDPNSHFKELSVEVQVDTLGSLEVEWNVTFHDE